MSDLELLDFDNALEQFQQLVEKMIIQKTKERSGLYTEDDDEIDYDKFYKTTRTLFGSAVKGHNIQAFFRKTINTLEKPDWLEIFGCFTGESDGQLKENLVFLVSEKRQITDSVVKRKDMIKDIVKVPHLDFTITASQKGVITIFNNQMKVVATISIEDTAWITGCDFLPQLQYVVAVTESTVIVWDYKSEDDKNNCFVIKPVKNCLLCVCTVTISDHLAKDSILMGDDKGYVYLLTMTSDHFLMKQYKAEKESQFRVLDYENFNTVKRKLHDYWVGRVKYISALKCFGSCSSDSVCSFVLDDIKRLEDNLPVREFSVPQGVNAFTYCGKAKAIVTGGNDRILRLWNPAINIRPTGKLLGHKHSVVEIVSNEKDQHVISLSCAKLRSILRTHYVDNEHDISRIFQARQGVYGKPPLFHTSSFLFRIPTPSKCPLKLFSRSVDYYFVFPLGGRYNYCQHTLHTVQRQTYRAFTTSQSQHPVFRVWDIQTLAPLQVFHDNQGSPEELDFFPMVFDNDHGILITGSDVVDIYPLAHMIEDKRQLPQTHEKSISAVVYNRILHQILTICTESILKVWDLETGYQIYQIEDAHGVNTEVTCADIEINGFYLATGACDGTVKIWEFESGQEFKALSLAQHSKDEHRVLKIVYLKADESQHALLVLEQRGKIKLIQGNSAQTHLYVTWMLPEAVPFPRRNPVVYLILKYSTSEDLFPAIRLLSNISSLSDDTESFLPSVEINCFAVLKVEGWNFIATGSANGEIILWDFESASVRCLHKTNEDSQDSESGINAILFLVHSAFTSRKRNFQPSTTVKGNDSASPEHKSSSLNLPKESTESDEVNTEIPTDDTVTSNNDQYPKTNVQLSKARTGHSPILASAHESGCICLWNIQGNIVKELLPFSEYSSGPLTVLCTDISTKMLLAGSKEGHIICWNIAAFLEDSQNNKSHVKEKLCWRAHTTKVVDLFYEEEKNVIVTASTDGSVRIWHADNGYYFGYFGQPRKFELSDTSRLILPSDVNNFPAIIREESKPEEKKIECPLMLDRDKWKSLTRLPLPLGRPQYTNVIQDFKFFQALAHEKMKPLETFEAGSKETGAVYGFLPIYELENPVEVSMPKSLQRIKALKSTEWTMDADSSEDSGQEKFT